MNEQIQVGDKVAYAQSSGQYVFVGEVIEVIPPKTYSNGYVSDTSYKIRTKVGRLITRCRYAIAKVA